MKYKCVRLHQYDLWLTVGEDYDGEQVISKDFIGGVYIYIKKADDKFPCYAQMNQFVRVYNSSLGDPMEV